MEALNNARLEIFTFMVIFECCDNKYAPIKYVKGMASALRALSTLRGLRGAPDAVSRTANVVYRNLVLFFFNLAGPRTQGNLFFLSISN